MKQRMLNTKFWSDSWVRQKLNPLDRYLFIYFLTNEHTNICGIYELSIDMMAFETGLDENDLKKSFLPRLKPKIYYKKSWVIIPKFLIHQNYRSPQVLKGIKAEISQIPEDIVKVSIGYGYGIGVISHLNLNSNLNLNPKKRKEKNECDVAKAPSFFSLIKIYFINAYEKKFNDKPAISFGKDGKIVNSVAGLFKDVNKAYKLIDDFLISNKGKEYGYTLSICFSTNTINLWKAGELEEYISNSLE